MSNNNFTNKYQEINNIDNIGINLYEILEISNNSSKNDIKKAYKKLILKYHPDKNNQKTCNKFLEVKYAFDILYDDEKREFYDKYILLNNTNKKDIFGNFNEKKIKELLKNFIYSSDMDKIILVLTKKKINYNYLENIFFNKNLIKDLVDINISIDYTLKDLWYGNSKKIIYNRVTKEQFNEEIYPFDKIQIYEGEGERIRLNNIELIGNVNIKINIINMKVNDEQYFIYNNELYILINSERIKKNKFRINFIDGNTYKFNLIKLNQIENNLGKFYVKKHFGLINNFELINDVEIKLHDGFFTHGNLFFIILI